MLLATSPRLFSRMSCGRCACHSNSIRLKSRFAYPEGMKAFEDDYTETPEYPPIIPERRHLTENRKTILKKIQDWHDSIRNATTVEEKLMLMNINRKHGWRILRIQEEYYAYKSTPFYTFATRTHVVPDYKLPDVYSDAELTQKAKKLVQKIKNPLLELLRFEFDGIDRNIEIDPIKLATAKASSVVTQVNRLLISALAETAPHLKSCQVDYNPHIEAFWSSGGFEPSVKQVNHKKSRLKFLKARPTDPDPYDPEEPVDRDFQYMATPLLQIRSVNPFSNYVQPDSELCQRGESIPDRLRGDLATYGFVHQDYRYATIIPGYWAGDDHRSSLLAIHSRSYLHWPIRQTEYWAADEQSSLDSQAIMASFARLLAQAYFYGFDQYSDINYPFSTQFISTDGLTWSFYAYQLNTIKLDNTNLLKNKRQNICWATKPMKILDGDQLNEEVVENLVKFYLQAPTPIPLPKEQVTPYLSSEKLGDMEDEFRRREIFENYRDMYIGKRLYESKFPFPEIHDWERIYKIIFKAMPLEARTRWFELPRGFPGSDPYREPYRLKNPVTSIPRALYRYRRLLKEKKEGELLLAGKDAEKVKYTRASVKNEEEEDDDEF